jgi:hypothetical protein
MENKKVELPSGVTLEIELAPFADGQALYQAIAEELINVKIAGEGSVANAIKDGVCIALSSKKIQGALDQCFKRCLYKGMKVDKSTWEPREARGDYLLACKEVAEENLLPFGKALFAQYGALWEKVKVGLKSISQLTPS